MSAPGIGLGMCVIEGLEHKTGLQKFIDLRAIFTTQDPRGWRNLAAGVVLRSLEKKTANHSEIEMTPLLW